MWKQVRRSLLLGAFLLAAAVSAQSSATGSDVLVTMPINVDGSLKDLQLMRGESFEAAAISFARLNGLMEARDENGVRDVVDQLSGLLKDKMDEIQASASSRAASQATMPSVQLSFPLAVDGYTGEVRKYEDESIDACVERFLYETGFNMDTMRGLFPQIVALVNQKLAELQPARKEIFSLELTIDNSPVVVRHFEGGNVMEEAIMTLRSININDGEVLDRLAPQVANMITARINEMGGAASDAAGSQQQPGPPQERQAVRELFSIPLTLNNQATVLVHVEGQTTRESAMRFLNGNGITDPKTVGSYLPQLVEILDNRMSEYIRDEAAAAAAAAQAPAPAPTQAPVVPQSPEEPPARKLLLTLPINLGDNRSKNLEYFEGDSVERSVELFLQSVGLGDSPTFRDSVAQLVDVIRQRLTPLQQEQEQLRQQQEQQRTAQAQEQQQATRPKPLITLPVTLSGKVYELEYFEGQEPGFVANTFCVEKHEIVRAELGLDFDGNQLQECKVVLTNSINSLLTQRTQEEAQAPQQEQAHAAATHAATASTDAKNDLLFTLDIDDGEGGSYQLPFYRNDDVRGAATAFCQKYTLDMSNVPALMEGIQAQLAQR